MDGRHNGDGKDETTGQSSITRKLVVCKSYFHNTVQIKTTMCYAAILYFAQIIEPQRRMQVIEGRSPRIFVKLSLAQV